MHIVSPLQDEVQNPLYTDLDLLPDGCTVIDLGTGRGDLLPLLARFKTIAIDFSPAMLAIAKTRGNATFLQHDARKLQTLRLQADAVIAVNSILQPHFEDIHKVLVGIKASLKPGGTLLAIVPSMEAAMYHGMLVYEREYERCGNEQQAVRRARKIAERDKYAVFRGVFDDDGERQKTFYQFELVHRLEEAGFTNITIKKVLYPWGEKNGTYEDFPGKPELWDWYVSART